MAEFPIELYPVSIPPTEPFPTGQTVYRPMLALSLTSTETSQHLNCLGLADTGADHCVFPLSFAAVLGLDPLKMRKHMTGGVGSTGNITYYADVEIAIPMTATATLKFSTLAGFTEGLEAQGIGLLGQMGFFENFAVVFDHKSKVFVIHGEPQ